MMNLKLTLALITFLIAGFVYPQDRTIEFNAGKGTVLFNVSHRSGDEFFLTYGKALKAKKTPKYVMKFNKELKPLWENPVQISGSHSINILSYTNPINNKSISYLTADKQFLQISHDGKVSEKETEFSNNERDNIFACFVDSLGFNFLINGKQNVVIWYTFSHTGLHKTSKTFTLDEPKEFSKNKNGAWLFNSISSNALYFTYVSYLEYNSGVNAPILEFALAKVDYNAADVKVITVNTKTPKHNLVACNYYVGTPVMDVYGPSFFNLIITTTTSSDGKSRTSYRWVPTDNAFLGILVDEANDRIYTCRSINTKLDDGAAVKLFVGRKRMARRTLMDEIIVTAYNMEGKEIKNSKIKYMHAPLTRKDNLEPRFNEFKLHKLKGHKGLGLKAVNNSEGCMYLIDENCKVKKESNFKLTRISRSIIHDKFWCDFTSLKQFESSPNFIGAGSEPVEFVAAQKKTYLKKLYTLALESSDVLIHSNVKDGKITFHFFDKK